MTAIWNPCKVGLGLIKAFWESVQRITTIPPVWDELTWENWFRWTTHRDSCESCKIEKETK